MTFLIWLVGMILCVYFAGWVFFALVLILHDPDSALYYILWTFAWPVLLVDNFRNTE